jgi:hypothetical protein
MAKLTPGPVNMNGSVYGRIGDGPTTKILYVGEEGYGEYPDFIEAAMLVSEGLKRILGLYQNDARFSAVALVEKKTSRQKIYYLMSAPIIDCAATGASREGRGRVGDFLLDGEKIGDARVFSAASYRRRVFVRLDVAESILRRDIYGVSFERVAVIDKEDF